MHFTFKQERIKRNFTLNNQHSRQNAKQSVEKDFFIMQVFSFDCHNDFDNCTFEPISDENAEISYIKTL